jgi:hypothetical protein
VLCDVLWWAANLGDDMSDFLSFHHLDGVPRADRQFVRVGLLLRNVDANFASNALLQVNLAPSLVAFDAMIERFELNTVDGAYFQTGFTSRAIVGVNYRQFLGDFLAGTFLGHVFYLSLSRII